MPSAALQAVLATADSLRATLSLARALAEAGRRIDVEGLERDVAPLCAAALALPPACGAEARHALHALRAELESLLALLPRPQAG
ncbi:hypothetical protein [Pseudoroseomonas cervicalis]|uniref:hypothetical protein n=1 Tax=Teichococcus cervicalis TaxID=204525 RepID=UPI0022F19DD5|nr:hypothetical protein [Pseudoroseomonas cervicalis]WBV41707.1 hypothetical protein PFY06_10705 [Pseudoroseomonas cervicalis]